MTSEAEEPIVIRRSRSKVKLFADVGSKNKRVSFETECIEDSAFASRREHGSGSGRPFGLEARFSNRVAANAANSKYAESEKADLSRNWSSPSHLSWNSISSPNSTSKRDYPCLLERGVPEGREDPKMYSSSSNLSDSENDGRSKITLDDRRFNAKYLLVKKFLKSIPSKRTFVPKCDFWSSSRAQRLHIPLSRIKIRDSKDYCPSIESLSKEIAENAPQAENVASHLKASLLKLVASSNSQCSLYKAYKLLGVEGCPLLAVITSESLCLVGYDDASDQFSLRYWCDFQHLLAAVIGPFSQLVIVLDECKQKYLLNTGISESTASELISHLEIAIRRWCSKTKKQFVFNVAQIYEMDRMAVFHDLLPDKDNTFMEHEAVIAQYTVWLQEDYVESSSPLGPEKEGYLMAKFEKESSWVPLYVCLKAGVLYLFETNSERIPKYVISLRSSCYNGCRIYNNSERPHTFEILLEKKSTLNFGAADELEMMEWIRDIYSSATRISNVGELSCEKESPIVNCFVTLSSNQILLHRFPNEIISRAFINNVTSFTKSTWPSSYYCLLELSCREASEIGGDWILYFVSEDSFQSFCSIFAEINNHSLTTYRVEDERFLSHKSDRISAKIRSSWDPFFIQS